MSLVRIAHLSDPHFGTIKEGVEEGLLATLRELRIDLILLSGDITQRARKAQFQAARAFKQKLEPTPAFAVPGNHDIPLLNIFGRLFSPYHGFHKYFQHKRETDLQLRDVRVIGLNSTSRWRHVQGSLTVERIRPGLMASWKEAKVRVVALHHPLDCAKTIDDKNKLKNRGPVLELFQEAEIDLVVAGHVHDPFVTLSTESYPGLKRSMILSVAGTCLSWRTRKGAPNSFHLIEIGGTTVPEITITRMDIAADMRFYPRPDKISRFTRPDARGWAPTLQ